MPRRPTKKEKPKAAPESAYFPRQKELWFWVFRDGVKEWMPACKRGNCCAVQHGQHSSRYQRTEYADDGSGPVVKYWVKGEWVKNKWVESHWLDGEKGITDDCKPLRGFFVLELGRQEISDNGLEDEPLFYVTATPDGSLPRWMRICRMEQREVSFRISRWGKHRNGKIWTAPLEGEDKPDLPTLGFHYGKKLEWGRTSSFRWIQMGNDETPARLAFDGGDSSPASRPCIWWIRHGKKLKAQATAPAASETIVAKSYRFISPCGKRCRVDVAEAFTAEEWQALRPQGPATLAESLDRMEEQIAAMKPEERIYDKECPLERSWQRNPVFDYHYSAGLAFKQLKRLLARPSENGMPVDRESHEEQVAQQALELGQNYALLLTSRHIPTLRKREKMDKGREKKPAKIDSAVREFVRKNLSKSWLATLNLLIASTRDTESKSRIGWNGKHFSHVEEEKPKWAKSTMGNRIQVIQKELRDARKSGGM